MLRRRMARPTKEAQEASVYFNAMTGTYGARPERDHVVIEVSNEMARVWADELKWTK